jgi:hypothetical protein
MREAARTQILPGGRLEIVGNAPKVLDGRPVVNQGLVAWIGGGAITHSNGATWTNDLTGQWEFRSDARLLDAGGAGSSLTNLGTIEIAAGRSLEMQVALINAGTVDISPGSTLSATSPTSGYLQTAGVTLIDGTLSTLSGARLDGGILSGSGVVQGSLLNNAVVQPGGTVGTLTIDGNYTESSAGSLNVELAGPLTGSSIDCV